MDIKDLDKQLSDALKQAEDELCRLQASRNEFLVIADKRQRLIDVQRETEEVKECLEWLGDDITRMGWGMERQPLGTGGQLTRLLEEVGKWRQEKEVEDAPL